MLRIICLLIFNFIFLPIYFLVYIFCFILSFIPIFPTKTAKENIKNQLNTSSVKAYFYISRIYLNYFFYFIEAIILGPLKLTRHSLRLDKEIIQTIRELKNISITYLVPHMGNVELYVPATKDIQKELHEKKVYALAKPTKFEFINTILLKYRQNSGLGVLWTDKNLLKNMSRVIKDGYSIAMLVDQKPSSGGVFVKFFNAYAAFPTSGLRFCTNKNSLIVYSAGYRIIPGWVNVHFHLGKNVHLEMQTNNSDFKQPDIWKFESILEKEKFAAFEVAYYATWLAEEIKKHPTQWCWDYRKWSRKPT